VMLVCPAIYAADGTWGGANGDWDAASKWSLDAKPDASGTATFSTATGTAVDNAIADQAVKSIFFDGAAGSYTIGAAGSNKLSLTSGGAIAILNTITSTSVTETIASNLSLGGNYTFNAAKAGANTTNLQFTGNITNTAVSTLSLAGPGIDATSSSKSSAISGVISNGTGTQSVTISGGTWTLSGANTYSGETKVTNGTLILSGTNTSSGNITATYGMICLNNTTENNGGLPHGTLFIQNASLKNITSGPVSISNPYTLWGFSGTTSVQGTQDITFTGIASQGWGNAPFTNNVSSANGVTFSNAINLNGNAITFNGSGKTTVSGSINNGSSGTPSVTYSGNGSLVLSGTNNYKGATTLTSGVVSVGTAANLGAATAPLTFNGGTLRITGTTLTSTSGIGHTVSFTAAKSVGLDIADSGNTFTVDQVLNQTTGGLTKLGAGTLVVNQANSYTGATNIEAGKLLVNGSLAAGSQVNVKADTTLGGHGTINSLLSAVGASGHLAVVAPGNGTTETLTLADTVATFGNYSQLSIRLVGDNISKLATNKLDDSLSLNLASASDSLLIDVSGAQTQTSYVFATYTGALAGNVFNNWSIVSGGQAVEGAHIDYTSTPGSILVVIPEPATGLMLGIASVGLLARRRRVA